ncbi:hypothetical protein GMA19_02290 [Paenibacillus polymyxa E681]|uniref:MerR family DNA-binding transcriptional regulator n=1 Tax=Paenibacillus polymyxa TaxID=1406 RepID=UPI0001E31A01|nr:MerR family DNA-binding transcriptional regulator [Paenibacillus polymyxa]ADM70096.1 hypothetical protein PPE_02263 [Paenibacillus polymyxa E681]QNV57123.1 hypothetical protein GE561_02290 [Paenibacillus polymyxa E681]QNV61960.1 hypothetical protein GMA19_02290 [Paenibacillus polymyxa E681]
MENNVQTHLTSGQFAKVMGISKDTLFHYDRLGILSPEFKAENGYRYYSIKQLQKMKSIISEKKRITQAATEIFQLILLLRKKTRSFW